jgi:TPR repeat protein
MRLKWIQMGWFTLAWPLAYVSPAYGQSFGGNLPPSCNGYTHYTISAADNSGSAKPRLQTDQKIDAINQKLAASGNTDAAFELGLAYMQGLGVEQDLALAQHWFEIGAVKPADKGMVGMFYAGGVCFAQNDDEAIRWFLAAGRSGDRFTVAQIYARQGTSGLLKAGEMYRELLLDPSTAEYRRAQMELGNLVLDGKYSAGVDATGHALNLEWARIITQELLSQQEYTIAVAYSAAVDGVPKDEVMWLRFCKRAAAYNMDLAQQFYGRAILNGEIKNVSPYVGYAWLKLASDKQYSNKADVQKLEQQMSPEQLQEADSMFQGLVQERARDGAYYVVGDPLAEPTADQLAKMAYDDPDVQLRRAFELEKTGDYEQAMQLYRIARDRRAMDVKVVLGRDHLYGTDGVAKSSVLAKYWLKSAVDAGSRPAALLLAKWYSGDGGTDDPVQALTWELVGHEGAPVVTPKAVVTKEQMEQAATIYAVWLATHPGWVAVPNRLVD